MIVFALLCTPAFGQTTAKDWVDKGDDLCHQGKYDEAIQAYDNAIELNPSLAEAWNNKGVALGELGKYEEAIECFNKAIEIDPQLAKAWNNKGVALYKLGKYDESLKYHDKAIEIDPQLAEAWDNKSFVLYKRLILFYYAPPTREEEAKPAPVEIPAGVPLAPVGTAPTMPTAPVTTPTTPVTDLQKIIDEEWNKLPIGVILFNPPTEMQVGKKERIEARVARNITGDLDKGLKGRGEPQLETIKVSTKMIVELKGDNFEINPLFKHEEMAIVGEYTQWDWDVTPLESGNQTLILTAEAVIEIPGYPDRVKPLPVLEREIKVKVNPSYTIKDFIENNYQWIIGTLFGSGIILWFIKRKEVS